jgi:hypothetical protein
MRSTGRHRTIFCLTVAGLWAATVIIKGILRPGLLPNSPEWVRLVLGSAPSLLGAVSVPLCFLAVHPNPGSADIRRACLWGLATLVVAESVERFLPRATFDWLDLASSTVGIVAAALLSRALLLYAGGQMTGLPRSR